MYTDEVVPELYWRACFGGILTEIVLEWNAGFVVNEMNDCCITPHQQFRSHIVASGFVVGKVGDIF